MKQPQTALLSPTSVNESLEISVATHLSGLRVRGPFTTFLDSLPLMSLFAFTWQAAFRNCNQRPLGAGHVVATGAFAPSWPPLAASWGAIPATPGPLCHLNMTSSLSRSRSSLFDELRSSSKLLKGAFDLWDDRGTGLYPPQWSLGFSWHSPTRCENSVLLASSGQGP